MDSKNNKNNEDINTSGNINNTGSIKNAGNTEKVRNPGKSGRRSANDLTTGTVWMKLVLFFLPIAAGTCIQQLYNTVDGLIVGRFVGTIALAAVGGSSAQIINLLIGFFVATTAGASVVIAQIYGAGRPEDVRTAAGNALVVFAFIGIVLMGIGLIGAPWMLRVLKTPEDTLAGSVLYLRIYFLGVPFILLLNIESNMLRAVGDSVSPFLFMVVGCVVNIALDVLFVVVFGWGIAGVAIATVISQIVNMLLLTRRLLRPASPFRMDPQDLKLRGVYLSNMCRLGIPAGLQSSMYAISNMVVQVGINTLGTVVVASWAMTAKTDGIYWAVSNALGSAITSFIGQNLGAGRKDRVKDCVRQGMILSLGITITLSVLILMAGKPLLRILTKDPEVIRTTFEMMTYFVPFYFTWAVIEVLSAVLRGAGDALRPVIIIGLGVCLLRIVWIFTIFERFHTLPVLCSCYAVSWVVTGTAMSIYFRKGKWLDRSSMILGN